VNNEFHQIRVKATLLKRKKEDNSYVGTTYAEAQTFVVIGEVKIQFGFTGKEVVAYNEDLYIDTSATFDPEQPLSARFTY